jgi:TonB family protein
VIVRVIIDEDGNVTDAQVASGHPLLRLAALDAARGWKFKPAEVNRTRVPVVGNLRFNFVLPVAQRRTR